MERLLNQTNSIVGYSTVGCPDCKQVKKFLGEQRVSYANVIRKVEEIKPS